MHAHRGGIEKTSLKFKKVFIKKLYNNILCSSVCMSLCVRVCITQLDNIMDVFITTLSNFILYFVPKSTY